MLCQVASHFKGLGSPQEILTALLADNKLALHLETLQLMYGAGGKANTPLTRWKKLRFEYAAN